MLHDTDTLIIRIIQYYPPFVSYLFNEQKRKLVMIIKKNRVTLIYEWNTLH